MTNEKVKRMLDACYQAKRIRELLPPLPQGVMPSYIQYMDTIQKLEKQGIKVKISDISDAMNLPRPGVTRTVKEMEAKGYLHKFASKEDGRVTYIAITEEGKKLSQKYDKDYFCLLYTSQFFLSGQLSSQAVRLLQVLPEPFFRQPSALYQS